MQWYSYNLKWFLWRSMTWDLTKHLHAWHNFLFFLFWSIMAKHFSIACEMPRICLCHGTCCHGTSKFLRWIHTQWNSIWLWSETQAYLSRMKCHLHSFVNFERETKSKQESFKEQLILRVRRTYQQHNSCNFRFVCANG